MAVDNADARALWELGVDVHAFSRVHRPGDVLAQTRRVTYFYNPANLSAASQAWLETSTFKRVCLPSASHWKCFDQSELLAERMIAAARAR